MEKIYLDNGATSYPKPKEVADAVYEYMTSIGANISEAQRGQSKADFAAKMNIALKEASETEYWLKLLYKTEYLSNNQFTSLYADIQELLKLLIAICRTANNTK